MFFAEDGGDPERLADWRAASIVAAIINKPSGWGDKPRRTQPKDFMVSRPEDREAQAGAWMVEPTQEDVDALAALADRLEAAQGMQGSVNALG